MTTFKRHSCPITHCPNNKGRVNELSCGWANDPVMICRHPVHKIEWAEAVGYDFETETRMEDDTPAPEPEPVAEAECQEALL